MNAGYVTALLALSSVASCFAAGEWQQTSSLTDQPACSLAIRAKHPEVKAGAEIRVEIIFRNLSNREMLAAQEIKNPDTADENYKTFVRDEKGELAPETKHGRRVRTGEDDPGETTIYVGSPRLFYLQPGEPMKEEINLKRLYDLSKPGKYTVEVRSYDGTVKSNIITVTVTK